MNDQSPEVYKSLQALFRALSAASSQGLEGQITHGHSDIAALGYIGDYPGCIVTDVSHALAVGLTTASSIVDRLTKKGLVQRDRHEQNRRIVVLHLTIQGLHIRTQSLNNQMVLCQAFLESLSPAERPYFARLIAKIAESVEPKQRPTGTRHLY